MLARALVLLLLWSGAASAQVESTLPFSEHELSEALSARTPDLVLSDVRVERAGELFVVTVGLKARVVDLAGSSGADAARVVALVALDLAQLELPQLAAPQQAPSAPPRERPFAPDRARLGVDVTVLRGLLPDDSWGFTLGLGAAVIARKLLSTLHAAYWSMPSERSPYTPTLVRFDALLLRAALGVQIARCAFALGPLYARYWVRGGRGHEGNLFGASLQGALWLPAARHARLGVGAYLDAYPRRIRFYAGGPEPVLSTPSWALGLVLSLAWGWA